MAARTSWNPRPERASDYLDDDAFSPAYDDLLDSGFDEYGRVARRRSAGAYSDDPRQDELRRAVDSLARQVEAVTRQAGRARAPAQPDDHRPASRPIDALDRLEARLDALSSEAAQRNRGSVGGPDMARQLEAHSEAGRAQAEALMERHFAALDQRIAALHDLARGRNVEGIRDDLATLGDRIDGLATNGESVSGSLSLVREQLDELRNRLESEGWNGANALTGMQDRLELITDKLAQLELTPSALSAVERGYSHILERVSRIEQLSGQNVAADDLWERLDELRDQIGTMGSGEGIASLEARIAGLAENIEHLSANRGHDPAFDRVELKLADMARTIAIIRDRRDMHSGAVEARLADITARIDKFGQERGRIDFTPVERQIASLSSRIDQIGNRAPDVDLAAMERQFAELGGRIEEMLKRPAQGAEDRPAFDNIESRLGELQSRLEDVYAAADRSPATADPSEALGSIDKRLVELHGRLDDLTIASGVEPSELTPIATRLDAIDDRLKAVSENASSSMSVELAALSDKMNLIDEHLRTMAPSNPDLPILLGRLEDIESQVRSAAAKTAAVDLSPLTSQLSVIERQLSESAPAGEVDLRPVDARLQGIEGRLEDLMISMPADSRSLADRLEAIDRRFDQLSGGSPDLSPLNDQLVEIDRQLRGLTAFGTAAALDWSPITDRLDDLSGRLSDYQPGQSPDLSGLQETLATIDERLDRLSAGGSPASGAAGMNLASENIAPLTERLQAIEAHLSTLASGAPEAQGSISPVAERLQAIEQRLENMQAGGIGPVGDDDGRMVPLLETIEAALRKISTSDDIAALNEKVGGLHAALDNAGEGSALEDMADLRNDITYLRRELRSMPMMAEAEDGSGGLGTLLAEIKDRLDRIPDGQTLGKGPAGEGGPAIAAVVGSIENSINELKQATSASDDDIRHALHALNLTMEAIVGRMAYLETGAGAPPEAMLQAAGAYQPQPEAEVEPAPESAPASIISEPEAALPAEDTEIPEISIGGHEPEAEQQPEQVAEPAFGAMEPAAEVRAEPVFESRAEAEPQPEAAGLPELAEGEEGAEQAYETPAYDTPAYEPPEYETPPYDAPEQAGESGASDLSASEQHVRDTFGTLEQAFDTAETESSQDDGAPAVEAGPGDPAEPAMDRAMDQAIDQAVDETREIEPPAASGAESQDEPQVETRAESQAGSQSILGRLTSSQILKRATGGRAESFTPESEEAEEGGSDTLYEPGTDAPMDSSLQNAPSSDTAVMSGEGAETRMRQGAGLGDLAAASGLGINGENTDDEQGNQFLSAARRAARAAVLEASQFDPAVTANARPVRKTTKRRNRRALLLAIILMGLLAFAGYKYWRGELDFKGISIGGFSLAQFGPATAGDALPVASAEMSQPAADGIAEKTAANAEGDALPVSAMAAKNETVELKPISPSGTIAFSAPDSSSKPLQSGTRTADTAGNMIAGLITAAGEHLFAAGPGKAQEPDDSFGSTASVPGPLPKTDQIIAKAGEEPASDTVQKFAAALREAATRTASLPDAGSAGTNLPTSIGSAGLRQAAQAGIPEAQFEIASRFADGSGVKPDIASAAVWYEKAAAKGLAPAQFRLGSLYEKGNGRPLNRDRAAELYLAASEAGNAKAMHNLAVLYAEGGTGTADLEKAAIWFRKAAEHGVHDSQFNVGILYARGLGVEKDFAQAYKWFAIAAKTGDEQAAIRRDTIAASMNQNNLAKALAAANIFQPIPLKSEANLVIEPRGGWATAALDDSPSGAELVRRIQTLLMERGFDPGPADGVMGRRTVGAIEAFQVEAGIAVSGRPDLAVLSALESGEI